MTILHRSTTPRARAEGAARAAGLRRIVARGGGLLGRWLTRHTHDARPLLPEPFWDRNSAFMLGLAAYRQGEWALAEAELTRGQGARGLTDAHCLNLLGVILERRRLWSQARQCYSRAARLDRSLTAPRENLRRYYELSTLGASNVPYHLGDQEECHL